MTSSLLVITGFMGTGKTIVGRLVAEKLGREFVDMDAEIESREGQSVRSIFETRGEEYFRAQESELCAELATRNGLVIATGGGTLVNPGNRARFANAFIMCLDATLDTILARLTSTQDRPLLAHAEALFNARREAYAQILQHVDTTKKTPAQVAEDVLVLFAQATIERMDVTTPDGAYSIFVGADVLDLAPWPTRLNEAKGSACALITNTRVSELHAARVVIALCAHGFELRVIEIPDGEKYKTLDTVRTVYDQLIDARLDRRSIIFALGGGVVGDLAGFVAATFLRGVSLVQMPTTLLAMVDASIGGKVAVDHPRGKNLIGAFKQPRAILTDTNMLATLPDAEWRAGMAEVVKHAIIADVGLFEMLERDPCSRVEGWIARAVRVKVDIVTRDPFEQGERAKLNLGHTFGHALEKVAEYELRHGDAVAIGLVCATRLAARLKMCDNELIVRIEKLLRGIGLPTHIPRVMDTDATLDAMQTDKKRVGAHVRFVLPRALGDVVIVEQVAREDVRAVLEEVRE